LGTATAKPGDPRWGGDRLPRVNSTPLLCECEPSGQLGSSVVFSRETAGWAGEAGVGSRFDDTIPPIPARSAVNCPPQAQDRDLEPEGPPDVPVACEGTEIPTLLRWVKQIASEAFTARRIVESARTEEVDWSTMAHFRSKLPSDQGHPG